ncbi:Uma2 family endonuclease [Planctomycetaceae bacterium SH139]
MTLLIRDPVLEYELIEKRKAIGADRYDEVWDGVYVMSPLANNEHQDFVTELAAVFRIAVDWKGLGKTLAGANVSDRRDGWKQNYRVPDVLVFLSDCQAIDCGTHWFGGPDLAIEVVSEGDQSLEKLDFYAKVNTAMVLVIDRNPMQLTLYRNSDSGKMQPQAISNRENPSMISLGSIPVSMGLVADTGDTIQMRSDDGTLQRDICASNGPASEMAE